MITDIIWDFDGTLFDTYPWTAKALKMALEGSGIHESCDNILNYLMLSEGYAVAKFKELYKLDDLFVEKYKAYKCNFDLESIKPFPYASEICRDFALAGGRNYILTHRGDSTLKLLNHHGMGNYFTEVITKEYGFKRKPDPEGCIYLIKKYNIHKNNALIIGDREYEIIGGKAAGIKTCLYNTNNISITEESDFYIDSLKDLVNIVF